MNINRLYKVEKIFGPDYDPITKIILFSYNDIKEAFYGKSEQGDFVINKIGLVIEDKKEIRFSSEMIADLFSHTLNITYWIQKSFMELSENYKMYED